jgi:hypothetical protein
MPWFIYLWGWHPDQVRRLTVADFWTCVDLAAAIKEARARAAT